MNMLQGIGTDIIEIKRVSSAIERYETRFLQRVFTTKEQVYCLSHSQAFVHFAGRFAAKEAVIKALGRRDISWLDIEITNNGDGKPVVTLSERLQTLLGIQVTILVSISHCREYATAFAILMNGV